MYVPIDISCNGLQYFAKSRRYHTLCVEFIFIPVSAVIVSSVVHSYISLSLCSLQSSKPAGVTPLLQLYRIFDGKTNNIPLSYCVGLEGAGGSYLLYLKAETTETYNAWVRVSWAVVCLSILEKLSYLLRKNTLNPATALGTDVFIGTKQSYICYTSWLL